MRKNGSNGHVICRRSLVLASVACAAVFTSPNVSLAAESAATLLSTLYFNGETMSEYYTLGVRRGGLIVNYLTKRKVSEWATKPVSPTRTDFTWGDPNNWPSAAGKPINIEEWSIKSNCAGGRGFIWIDAYRNDYRNSSVHSRFKISTTRADLRVGNGRWVDITEGGSCGTRGQPYALNDVTTDPYSIRVWGNVYKADGVTVGRRFFWQDTMTYVASASDPCWKGEGKATRAAIKQKEAWWDSANGWTFGSAGSLGSNGEPDGSEVIYGRWQVIGKGAGDGWEGGSLKLNSESRRICLQRAWSW